MYFEPITKAEDTHGRQLSVTAEWEYTDRVALADYSYDDIKTLFKKRIFYDN